MIEFGSGWWLGGNWQPPTLVGTRIKIRPIRETDCDAVFAYSSNPNMTRYTLWETHLTKQDSIAFVREYAQSRYREQVPEPLAIVRVDDPRDWVIGSIGCFWVSKPNGTMELGYTIGEPHWNLGYATEASRLLLAYVFAEYPIERVQARCVPENIGSYRVMEKLGMHYEGTLRHTLFRRGRYWDLRYYSLLRDEYEREASTDFGRNLL